MFVVCDLLFGAYLKVVLWTKRGKFILASLLLTGGFFATQLVGYSWRYQTILGLAVLTIILSALVLSGELRGIQWLACLILPVLYTTSVSLFYFLLPEKLLMRIVILGAFAIGMYAILLTKNIFSIASGRTIQLLRAAQAVDFLMSLITAFFLYNAIFSYKLTPWLNFLLVFFVSLPLFFQSIWSIELKEKISRIDLFFIGSLSFLTAQTAYTISFWPLSILLYSLFLVSFFYIAIGLMQHYLSGRLFKKTVREYLQIAMVVLIVTFLAARWGK